MMSTQQRVQMRGYLISFSLALLLAGCGGGGGGDRAEGVEPGPPPPNTTPPPNPSVPSNSVSVADITEDSVLAATVVGVTIASPPTITFSLLVDGFRTISDLSTDDFRVTFAALQPGTEPEGLEWQSYVVTTEDPICRDQGDIDDANNSCSSFTAATDPALIPDSARKVSDPVAVGKEIRNQATYERSGSLVGNDDGTWSYTVSQDPGDAAGLDNMHRICVQFDLQAYAGNPCVDFIPSEVSASGDGETGTSLTPMFYDLNESRQVVDLASCNSCHSELAFHGGNRRETDYCVTCHNPDTTDANSANSQDLPVLIHRIHYSANIPSVISGTPYKIWGFRNGEHDYSDVSYPQSAANCTRCHAGEEDYSAAAVAGFPPPTALATTDGHNWATKPSGTACGSCHENNGHLNALEGRCTECHSDGGSAGSVIDSHRDLITEAGFAYRYEVLEVTNAAPGSQPIVRFRVVDPLNNDAPYDILNDAAFAQADSRLSVTLGWSTTDYTNTGNENSNATTVSINALSEAAAVGNNEFTVVSPVAIPDGSQAPFIAASGSGAATMEGRAVETIDSAAERIPITMAVGYFSIDEASGTAVARREIADIAQCNDCHDAVIFHGGNRKDNVQGCATCHNPRLVGSSGSSDLKRLAHELHAAADIDFPGDLANCQICHSDNSYELPLAAGVLGSSIDAGADPADPTDDTVISPETSACSSCHSDDAATAHMASNGGSFDTTQSELDDGTVVEQCSVCHRSGAIADVAEAHGLD